MIDVLTVIEPNPFAAGMESVVIGRETEEVRKFAKKRLARWTVAEIPLHVRGESILREGRFPAELLAAAQERSSDLIVISARKAHLFEGLLRRTRSEKVLRRAKCPVLIVPSEIDEETSLPSSHRTDTEPPHSNGKLVP